MNVAVPLDDKAQALEVASPPLPVENQLNQCYASSRQNTETFFACVFDRAMPPAYRMTRRCIAGNQTDGARAFACSTGNDDLMRRYDRYKKVSDCAGKATDNWQVANCVGGATLNQEQQYYLKCVTSNKGNPQSAAVCAIARGLTPEQQIALACAVSTGAIPYAFAACTGGQLLQRELEKCWRGGIATNDGCFGPNNEYRKALRAFDQSVKDAFGDKSVAYHAFSAWHNNVLAPGPNHEYVKTLNNALKDINNGPGRSNEIVRATQSFKKKIGRVKVKF